jgi:hypothetical protein
MLYAKTRTKKLEKRRNMNASYLLANTIAVDTAQNAHAHPDFLRLLRPVVMAMCRKIQEVLTPVIAHPLGWTEAVKYMVIGKSVNV